MVSMPRMPLLLMRLMMNTYLVLRSNSDSWICSEFIINIPFYRALHPGKRNLRNGAGKNRRYFHILIREKKCLSSKPAIQSANVCPICLHSLNIFSPTGSTATLYAIHSSYSILALINRNLTFTSFPQSPALRSLMRFLSCLLLLNIPFDYFLLCVRTNACVFFRLFGWPYIYSADSLNRFVSFAAIHSYWLARPWYRTAQSQLMEPGQFQ